MPILDRRLCSGISLFEWLKISGGAKEVQAVAADSAAGPSVSADDLESTFMSLTTTSTEPTSLGKRGDGARPPTPGRNQSKRPCRRATDDENLELFDDH